MRYVLLVHQKAKKELGSIPAASQKKIIAALGAVVLDPYAGKKLSGELLGKYSVRAWPYRIVYEINREKRVVAVLHVSHRKDAYK